MENWIVYGIIAAVCFALNAVLYKVASQRGNLSPYYGSFVFGIGIVLILSLVFLLNPGFEFEWKTSGIILISGIVWGIGFLAFAIAIAQKADVARLAPIYNTNTLLVVIMGIIFLHELPDKSQMFRVIAGAVLIVVGAVLVSV